MKKLLQQNQNKRRQTNVSKEEFRALREFKMDNNRLILTADKVVVLLVMDKADYIKKAELLKEETYKKIPEDPSVKQKNKLINILRNIKTEGGLNEESYRRWHTTQVHYIQYWHSDIQLNQDISKDIEATGGTVQASCP